MYFYLISAAVLVALALVMMIVPGFQFSITACFAFAALLVLMYYLKKCPTPLTAAVFKIICILLIFGFLAAAVTAGFVVRAAHPGDLPGCDYVVVLGAGVRGTVPSLSLRNRIDAAYASLSANPDTICVVSGGQGPDEDITEAACMKRELTDMGIDPERIWEEDRSTSTKENLEFTLALIEANTGLRPKTMGIVSSEYHLYRAGLLAADQGVQAVGIPGKTSWFTLWANYHMREIVAVWAYYIFGG